MTTITMTKIIQEINIAVYGNTAVCNCSGCRHERFNECETRLLLQIAPSLSMMPLKMDRLFSFNGYNPEFKYMSSYDRQRKILSLLKTIEHKNKAFKKEHSGSTVKTCVNCGLLHTPKYKHTIVHKDEKYFLCSVCIDDYQKCEHCNTWKRTQDFIKIHKDYEQYRDAERSSEVLPICTECYKKECKRCGVCGYMQTSDQFTVFSYPPGNIIACINCCETSKVMCCACGKDSYTFLDITNISDRCYCIECSEIRRPIHDHTYKPFIQHFHRGRKEGKVSNSALHFGFELEIERYNSMLGRTAMAEIIKDKSGTNYVYIVHDGSIDEGIEVVSHPFTWGEYKENINRWTDLLLFIRAKEWKANRPKAGFHVHMTKVAFATFHLFKFLKFFYREHNRGFICAVAQRNPTSFSVFSPEDRDNIVANAKDKANRSDDHYSAVNLNNKDTVEVRIFRGTLEPLYFHKNIEFLHAVFKYTRDHSPKQMEYVSFINYVQQHRKLYPCLWEFLTNDVGIKTDIIIKERRK